jgi:hypothetical protein
MADTLQNNEVGSLIRKAEQDFNFGYTQKSEYVNESLAEDINKIEAYLNSKHTSGETDSMGRDKPFFNIVIAARNIWFRATDLDRKHITVKDKNALLALIAKIYLQEWMKRNYFGIFLNNWGLVQAGYNEAIVKFVEQDGELKSVVVPWTRIICDSVNFASNPKIEILELTPSELKRKEGYDQEIVKELLDALTARETISKKKKDTKNEYIKLYEIHGELPLSYLTGKEKDEDTFVQQMQVVSFVASKNKGEYDDYVLIKGREQKDPYMLTALFPETDGSIGLKGSVKNLFEAQWMQNHSVKAIKDHLDLINKIVFQTSDGNFVGQNALTAIETGDILTHAVNQPLTQVAVNTNNVVATQSFQNQWKVLSNEINGVSEAMLGQNPPSGSAWRQTQALLSESHSLFEVMTENRGLDIERMLREYILPFIKRKLRNTKELVATLEANDIKKIDSAYIKSETIKRTNKDIIDMVLKGQNVTPEEQAMMMEVQAKGMEEALANQENVRSFKPSEIKDETWADVFKDMEWNLEIDTTGEASNTKDMVDTLISMLQFMSNPEAMKNPLVAFTVNRILSATGQVSPVEISQVIRDTQNMPVQTQETLPAPQGGAEVGGNKINNVNQ